MTSPRNSTLELSTMRTDHSCGQIYVASTISQLQDQLQAADHPIIIGGGSNVLFTQDTDRDIIQINLKGKGVINSTAQHVDITLGAGEDWHEAVLWTLEHNWGGIENLSLIPGKCGAAPMQNIGAYGVEINQVLLWVEVLNKETLEIERLSNASCQFGYRDSIFKNELKDKILVTKICLRLSRNGYHTLNTSYGAIAGQLEKSGVSHPTIQDVSNAVIAIRRSKLPDPAEIPNTGSFFKNPIIPIDQYQQLKKAHSDIPSYPVDEQAVKVPAGWLIDQAGWKGKRQGSVGVHSRQALVLVNPEDGTGKEIIALANAIQADIMNKYCIQLEKEVNIY